MSRRCEVGTDNGIVRLSVRVPAWMRKALMLAARRQGISCSGYIKNLLWNQLGTSPNQIVTPK